MDEANQTSPHAIRFQFRLITLIMLTTICCLHFGVAAYDSGIAMALAVFSTGVAIIYVARRQFRCTPLAAGLWAICGPGIALGALMAVTLTVEYFVPPKPGDPPRYVQSPDAIIFLALVGTFTGLGIGLLIAVVYWAIAGIWLLMQTLIIERRDKYYVEDVAEHCRPIRAMSNSRVSHTSATASPSNSQPET